MRAAADAGKERRVWGNDGSEKGQSRNPGTPAFERLRRRRGRQGGRDVRPHLIQHDLILTNSICNDPPFPNQTAS